MFERLKTDSYRTTTLTFDQIVHRYHNNPVSEILPNLFLSCIPTKESYLGESFANTDEKIIKFIEKTNPNAPLRLVASIVEKDESEGNGFYGMRMVQKKDWEERKIEQVVLPMVDRTAKVNNEDAISLLRKMKKCADDGYSTLVHCKAGHARSAMMCVAFLAAFIINPKTGNLYTVNEAHAFVKSKRPQVNLKTDKIAKARELVKLLRPMREVDLKEEADALLSAKSHSFWGKSSSKVAFAVVTVAVVAGTISRMTRN